MAFAHVELGGNMHIVVLMLAATLQAGAQDRYALAGDLQAMYDELAQATLSSVTSQDVDNFHTVFYTPDWTFTDRSGVRHTWMEVRDQAIRAAAEQPFDAERDVIRKISFKGDTTIAEVSAITVRTVTDAEGKYGTAGATHTIAEAIPMRDHWVRTPTGWKLQSREQIGDQKQYVDKLPAEMNDPKAPEVKRS
jgi:hypothetical protein